MATKAQIAANRRNAALSDSIIQDTLSPPCAVKEYGSRSGARTPEGRARAAQNAISFGLFTAANLVEPGEESEYTAFTEAFRKQLAPEGPIEEILSIETVSAAWRLRRCGIIESNLPETEDPDATQIAVDRARNQFHRLFLKGIAELRKLQTERQLRHELLPDGEDSALVSFRDIIRDLSAHTNLQLAKRRLEGIDTIEKIIDKSLPEIHENKPSTVQDWVRFVKPTDTPRNALCPCRSGEKYKRCCGRNAPPVLGQPAARAA